MNLRLPPLFAGTIGLLVLAACATPGGSPGPAAPAPDYRVGDRWVYRVEDGFRMRVTWEETHTVTTATPQGMSLTVVAKGPSIDDRRTETWSAPGIVLAGAVFDNETRRFEPPLERFKFPLAGGERWSQRMRDANHDSRPYGGIDRSVSVGGYERITTPAGTFDAIKMHVYMRLDDETFWRWPTDCTYVLWYAPSVGMTVREEKYAYYSEKGGVNGGGRMESQRAVVQLVSFTRNR